MIPEEKQKQEQRYIPPEYMDKYQAAEYICSTVKKIAEFRKNHMLKYAKLGSEFIYKRSWLDEFMEQWAGYDLSNPEKIRAAVKMKEWRNRHEHERKPG